MVACRYVCLVLAHLRVVSVMQLATYTHKQVHTTYVAMTDIAIGCAKLNDNPF